ncbi:hypothetical protein B0T17DRAFT_557496 [Bombardia bombarda]|uniref:Uncharacterized protein n=1 Tax=Bombardia bombarda TaxID=252184 RepID=A0AA40C4B5_9PEZI|nr:hypothetical protein B0T17DRAFT_557496 [Bombardia bombarda]
MQSQLPIRNMSMTPQLTTILSPTPTADGWHQSRLPSPEIISGLAGLPNQCYIFVDKRDYPPAGVAREALLAHFNVPRFVANRTCFELNGFSGCSAVYDEASSTKHVTSCTTWFRHLVKMVPKDQEKSSADGHEYVNLKDGKDYVWFEMTIFTRWDYPDRCQILCIDTPFDLPTNLQNTLQKRSAPLAFRDPFAMHADLLDHMIVYSDISVWRLRDPVRRVEKTRHRIGAAFAPVHELSRHATHTSEVLEGAIETLGQILRMQTNIHKSIEGGLGKTYEQQAQEYVRFQISLVKNLKLRSDSTVERLKNEVGLAFNNLSREDNSVMKSIALLTMIFLPPTFFSALFSTTFFTFGDDGWAVSDKLWIYWATIIPATIVVVALWSFWMLKSDAIVKFLGAVLEWSKRVWENLRVSMERIVSNI